MSLLVFQKPYFGPWPPEAHTNGGESECAGAGGRGKIPQEEHLSQPDL